MKFKKFGKALLISALSAGVILSVTSCIESYAVGYLYVTGTVTAGSSSNGIISGFGVDHNTGQLTPINGLPIASGGANPVRAVLIPGGRFIYVLNQGVTASGGSNCSTTDPCQNSNITQFAVGGNGILTAQETFNTQGLNPIRLVADPTGSYILALDHDSSINGAPSSATNPNPNCAVLGAGVTTCGDVTVFRIDPSSGRLTLVQNAQVTTAGGTELNYFPILANPIDFVLSSGYLLTLSGTPATGDSVFPYSYNATSGQLTVNPIDSIGSVYQGTAIVSGGSYVYVLDNEPGSTGSPSQILPFSLVNGILSPQTGGAVPDDAAQTNPIYLLVESKGKWAYVANQGSNIPSYPQSGLAGWVIDPATHQLTPEISGSPWGSGAGPMCLVEDPSNQYLYTANAYDSTVTGRVLDQNVGTLFGMTGGGKFPLNGPATWCLMDGRTN